MTTKTDNRLPLIVGYKHQPFLIVGEEKDTFWCGIDAPKNEFPFMTTAVWRGEVPENAACQTCGVLLSELE